MTRTIPTIAAALFAAATLFASAAQACISCEYVPPVVNTPVYSHSTVHYHKRRVYTATRRVIRAARKLIVESDSAPRKVETAKAAPIETVPVALEVESENSSISTASIDKSESAEPKAAPAAETKVSTNVGCKKFFPTVGMTLTVPCE
jgi:hypothetical protein